MPETTEKKKTPGKPRDPNKLIFRSLGLRPAQWEYLRKFAIDADYTIPEFADGSGFEFMGEDGVVRRLNPTPAIGRLVDELVLFRPNGPQAAHPRDEKGRFVSQFATAQFATAQNGGDE